MDDPKTDPVRQGAREARAGPPVLVERFVLGPFETNCYVVGMPGSDACWIVDAGYEPGLMLDWVRERRLRPERLVLTHAHADHVAGLAAVRSRYPGLEILIHEAEADWPGDPNLNLSALMGVPVSAPGPTGLLHDGDRLELGGRTFQVIHVPGHSPGGIALYDAAAGLALVGDALFAGSIGRTDFPGSDHDTLIRSIRQRLYALPGETVIHPGHGPGSTIEREKQTNPFVRG